MKKALIYTLTFVVVAYLGYQSYILQRERHDYSEEFKEARAQQQDLQADNERLREQIEYFSDPHNLEKELRERFNYKLPYEKLIIVVPEKNNGTSTAETRD